MDQSLPYVVLIALSAISFATLTGSANANVVDLTTSGSSGEINGAQFFQYSAVLPAGTGVFGPFLRIQKNVTEKGYNTNGTLEFDTKSGIWTHALQLGDIPLVNGFRQFALDINETPSNNDPLLTMDQVQLFVTNNANITDYSSGTWPGATKVYDMDLPVGDPDADNWVKLNYSLSGSGSGRADMLMYVPDSFFTAGGATSESYIVLFSEFGVQGDGNGSSANGLDSSDGFEEWSLNTLTGEFPVPPSAIPVPASVWLFGSGLLGLVGVARRRKSS
jgi:hypothetical protein